MFGAKTQFTVLGDVFHRKFYTVYDFGHKKVYVTRLNVPRKNPFPSEGAPLGGKWSIPEPPPEIHTEFLFFSSLLCEYFVCDLQYDVSM